MDGFGAESAPVESVDIGELLPADSPRLSGENAEHVRMLAEAGVKLPPILVDRRTMRVVDGMHRLCAMTLRGAPQIEVRFFDGTVDAAFLAAVKENISHGLPLTRADREAAVIRIMDSFPDLSDRAIASICGFSHKTVAAIRKRSTAEQRQLHARTGLDGRVRPLTTAEGRRAAKELILARPDASLREIARETGISPNTARDVRARLQRGEDTVPVRQRQSSDDDGRSRNIRKKELDSAREHVEIDVHSVLQNMKRDPSIRFTDAGRRLLHWLDVHAANFESWPDLIEVIPPYHIDSAAALARRCARVWDAVAEKLDHHPVSLGTGPPITR